eukprot:TRINITY_DN112772_c0_g1_i1.p1 TRINITY_DN112772_c0_g1~~TRINITY_DN112772_c0_g1_i1.p1  ORF type:complete len:360 (+),score=93.29 TRINITY_DN112772_c0_g1_i1:64-1143(+)
MDDLFGSPNQVHAAVEHAEEAPVFVPGERDLQDLFGPSAGTSSASASSSSAATAAAGGGGSSPPPATTAMDTFEIEAPVRPGQRRGVPSVDQEELKKRISNSVSAPKTGGRFCALYDIIQGLWELPSCVNARDFGSEHGRRCMGDVWHNGRRAEPPHLIATAIFVVLLLWAGTSGYRGSRPELPGGDAGLAEVAEASSTEAMLAEADKAASADSSIDSLQSVDASVVATKTIAEGGATSQKGQATLSRKEFVALRKTIEDGDRGIREELAALRAELALLRKGGSGADAATAASDQVAGRIGAVVSEGAVQEKKRAAGAAAGPAAAGVVAQQPERTVSEVVKQPSAPAAQDAVGTVYINP